MTRSSVSRTEAALIILLTVLSPLSAADWFHSNPLMQKGAETSGLLSSGWCLEEEDGISTLYSDGNVVKKSIRDTNTLTLIEDGVSTVTLFDEEGRPLTRSCGDARTAWSWSERGSLLSIVETFDGKIKSITEYHSAYDGSSSRTERDGSVFLFEGDDFYYSAEDGAASSVRKVGGSLYIRENESAEEKVKVEESETDVTLSWSDGSRVKYDISGALLERKDGTSSVVFTYDEQGNLLTETKMKENAKTVSTYSSGSVIRIENYVDDVLSSSMERLGDGTWMKAVYRNGKHSASVHYDVDGESVIGVENVK